MTPQLMRSARLHAVGQLAVDELAVPQPGDGELLVRVDACGVCATDARKYRIGVNDGAYPFNPGHEWVGRVVALGGGVTGWRPGQRVYGDTYGGYADYATIAVTARGWSRGALALDDDMPLERAIFVEPLADCLHAVRDQAQVDPGDRVVVIGGGSMGLQIVASAARLGADVAIVEPIAERQQLARQLGACAAFGSDGWVDAIRGWTDGQGASAIIVAIAVAGVVAESVGVAAPGGRVVSFAGLEPSGSASVDLNRLHYEEIALVGSEWIGTPPNQRFERYDEARELLASGALALESLVTRACGFDDLERTLSEHTRYGAIKTIFRPQSLVSAAPASSRSVGTADA